jgi:hypothetical protein
LSDNDDGRLSVIDEPDDVWTKIRDLNRLIEKVEEFMVNNLGEDATSGLLEADQEEALADAGVYLDELQWKMVKLLKMEPIDKPKRDPDPVLDPEDKTYGPERLGGDN